LFYRLDADLFFDGGHGVLSFRLALNFIGE